MKIRMQVGLAAVFGALIAVTPIAAMASAAGEQVSQEAEYVATRGSLHMGTFIQSKLFAKESEEASRLSDLFEEEVAKFDSELSVHQSTPLSRLNEKAGEKVEVTPEIARMLREALAIAEETAGAFEPMIGPVVNLWKIGFGGERRPSDAAIERALSLVDRSRVKVWSEGERFYARIDEGQSIDLGAMAKGYIGTRLADILKKKGLVRGILDLGGNVVAVGERAAGTPWRVGIQHPDRSRGGYFAVVSATDESVITSGAYERYFEENGKRYSHILDPKTGRPATTDLSSVTVIDKDGARADALCTAFFVMGWEKTAAFLKAHPDIRAVLLHADMREALVTPSAASIVTSAESSVKLTVLD